nr:hypothetical protein [Peribacillus huizhouensis]
MINNGAPLEVIQSLLGHKKSVHKNICPVKWQIETRFL